MKKIILYFVVLCAVWGLPVVNGQSVGEFVFIVVNGDSTHTIYSMNIEWVGSGAGCGTYCSPNPESVEIAPGSSETYTYSYGGGAGGAYCWDICNLSWTDSTGVFTQTWSGGVSCFPLYATNLAEEGVSATCYIGYNTNLVGSSCSTNTIYLNGSFHMANQDTVNDYWSINANTGGCYPMTVGVPSSYITVSPGNLSSPGSYQACATDTQWNRLQPAQSEDIYVTAFPVTTVTNCPGCANVVPQLILVGANGKLGVNFVECAVASQCQSASTLCSNGVVVTGGVPLVTNTPVITGSPATNYPAGSTNNSPALTNSLAYNGGTNNIPFPATNGVLAQNNAMELGFSALLGGIGGLAQTIGNYGQLQDAYLAQIAANTASNMSGTNGGGGTNYWPTNIVTGSNDIMGALSGILANSNAAGSFAASLSGSDAMGAGALGDVSNGFAFGTPSGDYSITLPSTATGLSLSIDFGVSTLPSGVQSVLTALRDTLAFLVYAVYAVAVVRSIQKGFEDLIRQDQLRTPDVGDVGVLAKGPMIVVYVAAFLAIITGVIATGLVANTLYTGGLGTYSSAWTGLSASPVWGIVTYGIPITIMISCYLSWITFKYASWFIVRVTARLYIKLGLPV